MKLPSFNHNNPGLSVTVSPCPIEYWVSNLPVLELMVTLPACGSPTAIRAIRGDGYTCWLFELWALNRL